MRKTFEYRLRLMPDISPLPWKVDPEDGDTILDANGGFVSRICKEIGHRHDRANARYIVRAVNSHARLLAAARWALVALDANGIDNTAVADLRAAIASAEPAEEGEG